MAKKLKRMHKTYVCPVWCIADHDDPDDRPDDLPTGAVRHYGSLSGDHLDNLVNSASERVLRDSGGGWDGNLISICNLKTGERGPAMVDLNFHRRKDDGDGYNFVDLQFTAGEARSLAAALIRGAGVIEGLEPPVRTD